MSKQSTFSRLVLLTCAIVMLLVAACAPVGTVALQGDTTADVAVDASSEPGEVRIGYQRGGEYRNLLKARAIGKALWPRCQRDLGTFASRPAIARSVERWRG